MKKKTIFFLIAIFFVIIFLGFCISVGNMIFKSTTQLVTNETTSLKEQLSVLEESGDIDSVFLLYRKKDISIKSSFQSHKIPASIFYAIDSSENNSTVIVVHGLGGNRYSHFGIVKMFLSMGYNVIAYDQRSSGDNLANYTTFGMWESKDLIDYVAYVDSIVEKNKDVFLWGVSYGAATVGISLQDSLVSARVKCAILDSPMLGMKQMVSDEIQQMEIPISTSFLLNLGSLVTNLKLGFSYSDTDVVACVKKTKVPYLVMVSKSDKVTPMDHGKAIFEASESPLSGMSVFENVPHAKAYVSEPEIYKNTVRKFIKSCTMAEENNKRKGI